MKRARHRSGRLYDFWNIAWKSREKSEKFRDSLKYLRRHSYVTQLLLLVTGNVGILDVSRVTDISEGNIPPWSWVIIKFMLILRLSLAMPFELQRDLQYYLYTPLLILIYLQGRAQIRFEIWLLRHVTIDFIIISLTATAHAFHQ